MNGNGNPQGNGKERQAGTIIVDWITGSLGAIAGLVFIGFMAWSVNVWPLWIISIIVLLMMVVDIIQGAMNRSGSQG